MNWLERELKTVKNPGKVRTEIEQVEKIRTMGTVAEVIARGIMEISEDKFHGGLPGIRRLRILGNYKIFGIF